MKLKILIFLLSIIIFAFLGKSQAEARILFCVCSANCGGGINQCLTDQGQILNQGPCNTQPCRPPNSCDPTVITDCTQCSTVCGGGVKTCTNQCGSSGTYVCNQQPCQERPAVCGDGRCEPAKGEFCTTCPQDCSACTTPTPAPIVPPPPADTRTRDCANQGGYCANTTTNCNAPQDLTLGQCSNNTLCCRAMPTPTPGVYTITQTCNSSGTGWTTSNTQCTRTCTPVAGPKPPPPQCNSGRSCDACGVQCGVGISQCHFTTFNGDPNCTQPAPAGQQTCSNICPPGQNCVANACVTANSIAGNVFVDTNNNTLKDAGEVNYTGVISISSTGGSVTTAAGTYTVTGLASGPYTVSYTNLPTGYSLTYPVNGPPPSFSVNVGSPCNTGGSNSASCDGLGNIINLNFGITNNKPWIQCKGADCRIDAGFTSEVPTTAIGGAYANLNGSGGTPGLIFTGNATPNFGQGQASTTNWIVGGPTYGELYAPIRIGGIVKTSYNYVSAKASAGNITPTDLAPYCSGGIANCTLTFGANSHGVYRANGDVTLNAFTFPAGQNFVILVNGNLTIRGKILVPNGSTALFSASGNINIDKTLGETPSSVVPTIEGIYSADRSFVAQGYGGCTVQADLRFNVAGSIIANAALAGGSFQNQRDLCANDIYYPTIYFTERLDMVLNTPDFLKAPNFTYQEIAP